MYIRSQWKRSTTVPHLKTMFEHSLGYFQGSPLSVFRTVFDRFDELSELAISKSLAIHAYKYKKVLNRFDLTKSWLPSAGDNYFAL